MGKSTGSGYRTWPELAADPELLDEPIRPLIGALNATGWALTVFSCAGHPDEPDSTPKGRRQAHVDLVVNDLGHWQSFVKSIPRTPGIRVTEGALGPLPPWLLGHRGWHYRRLVFEPAPYDQPAAQCRSALDSALSSATSILQSPDPHTSRADTH